MNKRFVVIGASAASISFITKLRTIDKESEIICYSGEKDFPYNRCLLADYVSQDKSLEELYLKQGDYFKDNNITLHLNHWVTKIDSTKKEITVDNQQVSYDYLFLGVGTKPFMPEIGYDKKLQGVFTFHTAEDVQRLSDFIVTHNVKKAVVIGAGINGIESVSSLIDRDIDVTVIERCDQILPQQVDAQTSKYIETIIKKYSVSIKTNSLVDRLIYTNEKISGVQLQDQSIIDAECVIVAAGSIVDLQLVKDTDIATKNGLIIINQQLQTTVDSIYAAGDVCLVQDLVTKKLVKSATWSDAMLQGLCAATQFSERARLYPGSIGLRDSKFFDYDFYACGTTVGYDPQCKIVTYQSDDSLTKLYIQDQILKGFVLIGDISKVAEYKKLYLTQQEINF